MKTSIYQTSARACNWVVLTSGTVLELVEVVVVVVRLMQVLMEGIMGMMGMTICT